ncbi:hypothetical protein [Sorangium cellulosum]|nr:hypothetical protein [Sorangium cellulosum]
MGLVVVVWVSSTNLRERVGLWRMCSRLRERGVPRKNMVVVELDPPFRGPDAHESAVPTWCSASELGTLPARLSGARPWPRERHQRAVRLWSQYTAADPRPLARSCVRGVEGFPELAPLWAFLSSFFPRRTAEGTLRLSRFDELLPGPKPPGAGYPMLSEVYRLTERGMRLRDKGLDQLTDAPNLPIAGTEAYSPSAPWVLLEDGRLARL